MWIFKLGLEHSERDHATSSARSLVWSTTFFVLQDLKIWIGYCVNDVKWHNMENDAREKWTTTTVITATLQCMITNEPLLFCKMIPPRSALAEKYQAQVGCLGPPFSCLYDIFYTQFYSLSSPSDVKSCQLVWQLPATLVQNQWIWASQESQDALTDADGSHGDVDPEELQCVRKTIILIRNMLLCEWLHHISLCSISIYWTFIDQWPSSGKIASRSASFNGLARCRTMLTMAMNRMVVALPMQIRMPWTWRRGGVPTCDVFAAQFKRCIFFGDDLWMKWLTDGDENPCWLNCKWVILVMCECLAGLWGLPSPKSNFHTRSQPKRSSLSPVLGFGAKRHVSKVVKIQKDFGSTNLGSVGNHWKPILQFFLNTLTFPRF